MSALRDRWPAGVRARLVPPKTIGGRRYTETTWQEEAPQSYRKALARLPISCDGPMYVGDREAVRLVRSILPEIRNRRQLYAATAWRAFKWSDRCGYVRYFTRPLVAWAKAKGRAAARSHPRLAA